MRWNPLVSARGSGTRPPGRPAGAFVRALAAGAKLLQTTAPLRGFDAYVVGFHCAKGRPGMQMEAHHFCKVVNSEFLQCVLFDGNTATANLIGVEYIVSGRLFDGLPEDERGMWHPHNYEVFSGELVAPGLPAAAEHALMRLLVNSYGKTWHTWHSVSYRQHEAMPLPLGEPLLMWSFNREGECDPALKDDRNRVMGVDPDRKRSERADLVALARPQHGVDAMKDDFTGTTPVEGVVDAADPTR
jgi:hypothetical protein